MLIAVAMTVAGALMWLVRSGNMSAQPVRTAERTNNVGGDVVTGGAQGIVGEPLVTTDAPLERESAPPRHGSVSGRVVDPLGRLGAGVAVLLTPAPESGPDMVLTTGAEGRFEARGLALGEVVVSAEREGLAASEAVALSPQEPHATVLLRLEPMLSIMGRVTDARGMPVANARVTPWGDAAAGGEAHTDRSGAFTLGALTPKAYRLRVQADGFAEYLSGPVPAGATGAVLELGAGVAVSGVLETRSGAPVAGQTVTLHGLDGSVPEVSARTDSDGRFRVGVLPEGAYWALLESAGWVLREQPAAVTVRRRPPMAPVRLTVDPAGRITGHVRLQSGTPVAGVTVGARSSDRKHRRRSEPSAADGAYEIGGLPGGIYDVRIVGDGPLSKGRDDSTERIGGVTIEPGETAQCDVVVAGGAAMATGRVTGPGGQPVAGARVFLETDEDDVRSRVHTAVNGQFTFAGLPAGVAAWVVASAPGLAMREASVVQIDAPVTDLGTLRLESFRLPLVTGRVLAGNGEPVQTRITLTSIRENVHKRVVGYAGESNDAGVFVLDDVIPGTYQYTFGDGSVMPADAGQLIVAAEPATQRFDLQVPEERAGSLRGVVLNAGGDALAFARLDIHIAGHNGPVFPERVRRLYADHNGQFVCNGLPVKPLAIEVSYPGYQRAHLSDVAPDGGDLSIVLHAVSQ